MCFFTCNNTQSSIGWSLDQKSILKVKRHRKVIINCSLNLTPYKANPDSLHEGAFVLNFSKKSLPWKISSLHQVPGRLELLLQFYCIFLCKEGFRLNYMMQFVFVNGWSMVNHGDWCQQGFHSGLKMFSQPKSHGLSHWSHPEKETLSILIVSNFWALPMESLCLIEQ